MRRLILTAAVALMAVAGASAQNFDKHNSNRHSSNKHGFNKSRGYMGLVELSTGGSINGYAGAPVAVTMVNGYRFSPHFALGGGTGVQRIAGATVVPVFLHLRSDILDNWISPYVAFNAGYNVGHDAYEGFMAEPSLGVGFNAGGRSRLTVGAFCNVSEIGVYVPDSEWYGHYVPANNCVMGLKVGMSF